MPDAALLDSPLAGAEFLAVDTETNGQPKERCELTEVGAVLVGGGELHDRWGSLVGVSQPLGRGIQRFTGITQAMVDAAPPPEAVLPELAAMLRGRVLVAHNARFDERVLRQAFDRAALTWPDPPVICTVALARRLAPLVQRRGLAALADALGIEVEMTHRALPDAETCARVLCALVPRLCANARTIGEALALLYPRKPKRIRPEGARRPRDQRPDLSSLPKDPGVYVFRDADGHPLYVGKSVCLRTRARAHFTTPVAWTGEAEHVDYQPTESELGALVLENRLIKTLRPPGNTRLKQPADGYVYLRCRLDIAFPILEVAREPAPGHAICVGPVRGRAAAAELVEQLNSLFGLRHCGRGLRTRPHPSAYGQMGRCLSPCLGDLDPNLYRERLDAALGLFEVDGGAALLAHVERQMRAASAARRYERAAWLRRRSRRLESLIGRLGGVLRATHAGSRLVLAPHPTTPERRDAFWIVGGRVADWGPLPADPEEVAARTDVALRTAPGRGSAGGCRPTSSTRRGSSARGSRAMTRRARWSSIRGPTTPS
jgi:DNA polymerase-3 subunit epsilon